MAFGTQDDTDEVMNEINMTPMVDVMLVLLIIFIITVPVLQHAVNVELPRASSEREVDQPKTLQMAVDAAGDYFLNGDAVSDDALPALLGRAGRQEPQPALHIRGDRAVRYERVAQAMAAARQAGLHRIGFVMEPPRTP